ncbi:MAG: hypothetical protein FWD68_19040 [Alphaproteobacteria bacterium]|nr:hypothetical protein [Alphaproteobacteria bacterium]
MGSAKSTFSAIRRSLVDPNSAPLRTLPREDRNLFIAATNGHVLAFDNLSGIPVATADTLCRLATGGGFAVRSLFTDSDETMFNGARPIIAKGIDDFVTRPDLADRSIFLTLAAIPEDARRLERDVWAAFDKAKPAVRARYTKRWRVACGRCLSQNWNGCLAWRTSPFGRLLVAAGFGPAARSWFMAAYGANRKGLVASVIEANPVASAIMELMADRGLWHGTNAELLELLGRITGEPGIKSTAWPSSTLALGRVLHRVVTPLREAGLEMEFARSGQKRTVTLSRGRLGSKTSGTTVTSVITLENQGDSSDSKGDDAVTAPVTTVTAP